MSNPSDFELVLRGYSLVTVRVTFYIPDYSHIIQDFIWQTFDLRPRYPRVEQFLNYWRRDIDATIKDIVISDSQGRNPRCRFIEEVPYS